MDIIKNLFSNLYWRFNKENDLSDITWAVCQSSDTFQQLFLRFFFPNVEFNNIRSFTRELKKDDSRADFVIENNGLTYVIECKISDKNHHFEQYIETYNIEKEQLGYIVNYSLLKEGYMVKTWEQFHDFIKDHIPCNEDESILCEGYLEYLRNVCGIIKITKKMELKGIYSLYCLNVMLKSVINRSTADFTLSYYNTDFKESYYGYKFKVEANSKEDIWLNLGLWFNFEKPIITIGAWDKEGWGKPFCEKLIKHKEHNTSYVGLHYREDSTYYFEGSERFYKELEDALDIEGQKEILCRLVDEVVNFYLVG